MSEARLSALISLLLVVQSGIRGIRQMTSEDAMVVSGMTLMLGAKK
jgi:hypothetical protein